MLNNKQYYNKINWLRLSKRLMLKYYGDRYIIRYTDNDGNERIISNISDK